MMLQDNNFMHIALQQAQQAKNLNEVPVGAVLVKDNNIIAKGHNCQIQHNDPTAHAEVITLRNAGKILNNYRLTDTTLYVTLEPCVMCYGALVHARIKRLVFAATDNKTGCCGGRFNITNHDCFNHKITIQQGILSDQATKILQDFFNDKRK